MSPLLRNIHGIICAFEKYAKDDGDCSTLSKGELKQLIQKEFAEVIVDPYDPRTVETVLHLLDTDCDGKVGFEEFAVLLFKVVKACYKKVQECQGPADGPTRKDHNSTQQQEIRPPQVSPRPCQKLVAPKKVLDAEDLSQGQGKEKPRLEMTCDKPGREQPQQDPRHPTTQASSVQSVQKVIEDLIRGNPTYQTSQVELRTEQDPAQEHQNVVPPRSRCLQKPLSPDQEPSQDVLQNVTQPSSQQHQLEERRNTRQKEVTSQALMQERQTQQSAQEMEQIPAGKATQEPLQETLQGSSERRNQQVQVEEKRSAFGHTGNSQAAKICDQESHSVPLGQHQTGQERRQSQGVGQGSVAQQGQEVQASGQVISGPREHQMLTPQVHQLHEERERKPPALGQGQSEQGALPQEVIRPQVAERNPGCFMASSQKKTYPPLFCGGIHL
ncbi:cornulin-like [Candoia aspera]|uniref:cornulin-like n=1 Tax=Candoia aspera TaxID=51853 RepID=UPI002FD85794